jgi:hypothetical protein
LVLKHDGEELGSGDERRVGMREDMLAEVAKDEVAKSDSLGSTGGRGECVLTQAHGEEEGANDKVRGVVVLIGPNALFV